MTGADIDFLTDGPEDAEVLFIFAHGAGAPMDSPFMNQVAAGLAAAAIRVFRFEFPYMAARRSGSRKGPDRTDKLLSTFESAIAKVRNGRRFLIGGKSLGGRMATMIADEKVDGVICFGYPFHPPGKQDKLRTAHLAGIEIPVLILQGERDPFGTKDEVASYGLSPAISIEWIPDGDHSFKPRKRSGHTLDSNVDLAVTKAMKFLRGNPSFM